MKKADLMLAACLFASLPLLSQEAPRSGDREPSYVERTADRDPRDNRSGRLSEGEFRDRVAEAIQMVQGARATDIDDFCDKVTPGEFRLAFCMRAHEDQLSRTCRSTLRRVALTVMSGVHSIDVGSNVHNLRAYSQQSANIELDGLNFPVRPPYNICNLPEAFAIWAANGHANPSRHFLSFLDYHSQGCNDSLAR
jgi:hypothetical protein